MKLMTNNGELDLPADFSFEIELNNPFLSDEGDASIPATIPATPNNLKVLDNIHRVDRANRFMKTVPATLMAGTIQKHGQLIIDTLNMKDGIAVSLAIENSDMYSQYKEKSLKEIFSSKVRDDWNQDISALVDYLLNVYRNGIYDPDFTIFPVAVAPYEKDGTKIYQYNNERNGASLLWQAREVREGDLIMSVTDGYGLSPFLYLYKMIDLLFQEMGYYVIYNCLDKDPYRDIVLLNNCSDTIVKGVIRYSDLVPSCTLSEFIDFLFNKFGIHVRVDSTSKRVSVVTLQELFDSAPTMDITTKVVEELGITIEDSSRVVLSSETSIDGTAPAAETFDKLIDKYGYYIEVTETQFDKILNNASEYSDCVVMRQETGQFYELRRKLGSEVVIPTYIGTNYFKYDRNNSVSQESYSSPDVMPAMIYDKTPFMYIGNRLHYNTSYQNSIESSDQAIMIAWKTVYIAGSIRYSFGTTQKYFSATKIKDFSLTAYDMYEYFWSRYNNILLNGKVSLKGTVLYDVFDLSSLDMTKIKIYRGQKILPVKTVFEVSDKFKNRESEFILVKEYLDSVYDNIIVPETKQKYKWETIIETNPSDIEFLKQSYPQWFLVPHQGTDYEFVYDGYEIVLTDANSDIFLGVPKFENELSAPIQRRCKLIAKVKVYGHDSEGNTFLVTQDIADMLEHQPAIKETTVLFRYKSVPI